MSDAIPDDCNVLRPCKACGRYEWMQEWRRHCDEHYPAAIREARIRERRRHLEMQRRAVAVADPARFFVRKRK